MTSHFTGITFKLTLRFSCYTKNVCIESKNVFTVGYDKPLSIHTKMADVVKILKMKDSGLDVKTRMWLKITIPDAFIGVFTD